VRPGRHDEAPAVAREALDRFATMDQFSMRSEHAIALGVHAVASLRVGDQAAAWESEARAAALLTESRPVAYWLLEAICRTSGAVLRLLEVGAPSPATHRAVLARAEQVVRAGRQFARLFPIGRPLALLSAGSLAWM